LAALVSLFSQRKSRLDFGPTRTSGGILALGFR
jgi:hypothetical protein